MKRFCWRAARAKRGPWGAAIVTAVAVLLWTAVPAFALVYNVTAPDGTVVGQVNVGVSSDGKGVVGGFTSTFGEPPSQQAAAEKCGEHHFNWFQVVVEDNHPPNGPDGTPLTPPYIDPPMGGYGPPSTQWGDRLPWYWDEGDDPPAGTEGFEDGYNVGDNTTTEELKFQDFPWGEPGTSLRFVTWLVSCNEDGSLHSFHDGFEWTWERPAKTGDEAGDANRSIFPPPYVGITTIWNADYAPLPGADAYPLYDMLVGLPGDLNGDNFVGGDDLDIVRSFWGQYVPAGDPLSGDPSGDGFVGGDDLDVVRSWWGQGIPPAPLTSVPEPGAVVLMAGALVSLALWRRRVA